MQAPPGHQPRHPAARWLCRIGMALACAALSRQAGAVAGRIGIVCLIYSVKMAQNQPARQLVAGQRISPHFGEMCTVSSLT